jgi:hypothetical protein
VFGAPRQSAAQQVFADLVAPQEKGVSPIRRQRHWVHVPEFRYVRREYENIAQDMADREEKEVSEVMEECRDIVGVNPMSCVVAMTMFMRIVPNKYAIRNSVGLGIADAAIVIHGMHQAFFIDAETVNFKFLPMFGVGISTGLKLK